MDMQRNPNDLCHYKRHARINLDGGLCHIHSVNDALVN